LLFVSKGNRFGFTCWGVFFSSVIWRKPFIKLAGSARRGPWQLGEVLPVCADSRVISEYVVVPAAFDKPMPHRVKLEIRENTCAFPIKGLRFP